MTVRRTSDPTEGEILYEDHSGWVGLEEEDDEHEPLSTPQQVFARIHSEQKHWLTVNALLPGAIEPAGLQNRVTRCELRVAEHDAAIKKQAEVSSRLTRRLEAFEREQTKLEQDRTSTLAAAGSLASVCRSIEIDDCAPAVLMLLTERPKLGQTLVEAADEIRTRFVPTKLVLREREDGRFALDIETTSEVAVVEPKLVDFLEWWQRRVDADDRTIVKLRYV